MQNFQWMTEGNVVLPQIDYRKIEQWLLNVAKNHGKIIGDINYIFCDDKTIVDVNNQYLKHDYFTDIITFDRSTRGTLKADIYISLDTVESNAHKLQQNFLTELHRVIVHGVLHLCGFKDKTPEERAEMETQENNALLLLQNTNQ